MEITAEEILNLGYYGRCCRWWVLWGVGYGYIRL